MEKFNKTQKISEKAITLIALVITIIVLLILAGISISMLSGDNGILQKTGEARELTETKQTEEQIKLATIAAMTGNNGKIEDIELRSELKKNIVTLTDEDITGNEAKGWKIKVGDKTYVISTNGSVEEKEFADRTGLSVGDYVNYVYSGQSEYELAGDLSGYWEGRQYYEKDNTILELTDKTYTRASGMTWRILRIDEDEGTVDLIGTGDGATEGIYLQGSRGYNNGVFILNDMASKMYSNNKLGNKAIARSLNIDDLEKQYVKDTNNKGIMSRNTYSFSSGGITTTYGGNGATATSGTTQSYEGEYKYYPTLYAKEKYSGVDSETVRITGVDQSEGKDLGTYEQANTKLTVTQTNYKRAYAGRFNELIDSNNPVIELFPTSNTWLSSRCVGCGPTYSYFALRFLNGTNVASQNIFFSNSKATAYVNNFRPVISLDSSVKITKNTTHDGSAPGEKACIIDVLTQ